jgi:putative DNA primase/helicase
MGVTGGHGPQVGLYARRRRLRSRRTAVSAASGDDPSRGKEESQEARAAPRSREPEGGRWSLSMSLKPIVHALGGDLYAGGRRANVPAPGHSDDDRSVSLLAVNGRVVVHSFGAANWRDILDDLRGRRLITGANALAGASFDLAAPRAARTAEDRVAAARRLWSGARPIAGTLSARHLRLRSIERAMPGSEGLRHLTAAPVAVYATRSPTRAGMLAAIRDQNAQVSAVEITYLDPDGRRASGLHLPRKTIGVIRPGAAVRLDPAGPDLVVGEGVFTVLSASERFALPGWALLSAGNLGLWSPPPGVRRVLIAADRGPAGEAAAARLVRRLIAAGVAAEIRLPSPPFGDWNEVACG